MKVTIYKFSIALIISAPLFIFSIPSSSSAQYVDFYPGGNFQYYILNSLVFKDVILADVQILKNNKVRTIIVNDTFGICDSILLNEEGGIIEWHTNHSFMTDNPRILQEDENGMVHFPVYKLNTTIHNFSYDEDNRIYYYNYLYENSLQQSWEITYTDGKIQTIGKSPYRYLDFFYNDLSDEISKIVSYYNRADITHAFDIYINYDKEKRPVQIYDSSNQYELARAIYYNDNTLETRAFNGIETKYSFADNRIINEEHLYNYDGYFRSNKLFTYRKDKLIDYTVETYETKRIYKRKYSYKYYE